MREAEPALNASGSAFLLVTIAVGIGVPRASQRHRVLVNVGGTRVRFRRTICRLSGLVDVLSNDAAVNWIHHLGREIGGPGTAIS